MAYKQSQSHNHFMITVVGLLIAVAFLAYVASVVREGAGTTQSRASREMFLTTGDDALSLQQDLNKLQEDPGAADETDLDNLQ